MRKWLRRGLYLLAFLVILVIAIFWSFDVPGVLGKWASDAGSGQLRGRIDIERIGWSDGHVLIQDLRVTDLEGRTIAELAELEVGAISSLLSGRLDVVALRSPKVFLQVDTTGSNLGRLLPPSKPASTPPSKSSALPELLLSRVLIDDALFRLELADSSSRARTLEIRGVSLSAEVQLGPTTTVRLERFEADAVPGDFLPHQPAHPIHLELGARVSNRGEQTAGGLSVRATDLMSLEVHKFTFDARTFDVTLQALLKLTPRAFGLVGVESTTSLEAMIGASASPTQVHATVTATLTAPTGPSQLDLDLSRGAEGTRLVLRGEDLDFSALYATAPKSKVALEGEVQMDDKQIRGNVTARGSLGPMRAGDPVLHLETAQLSGELLGSEISWDARVLGSITSSTAAPMTLVTQGSADLARRYVHGADLSAQIPDLRPFSGRALGLRGAVTIDVEARGGLEDIRANARVKAQSLGLAGTSFQQLELVLTATASVDNTPFAPPTAHVRGAASGIRGAGLELAKLSTVLDLRPGRAGGTDLEISELRVEMGDLWADARMRSTLTRNQLAVSRLDLDSTLGPLTASATITQHRGQTVLDSDWPRAPVRVSVSAPDLQLSPLAPWIGETEGSVRLDLLVERQAQLSGQVEVGVVGLRRAPLIEGLDADLVGRFVPDCQESSCRDRLELQLNATEPKFVASAQGSLPFDRWTPSWTEAMADVTLGPVHLAPVWTALGATVPVAGDLTLHLAAAQSAFRVRVIAPQLQVSRGLPGQVALTTTVAGSWNGPRVALSLDATVSSTLGPAHLETVGTIDVRQSPQLDWIESVVLELDPLRLPKSLLPQALGERCEQVTCGGRLHATATRGLQTVQVEATVDLGGDSMQAKVTHANGETAAHVRAWLANMDVDKRPAIDGVVQLSGIELSRALEPGFGKDDYPLSATLETSALDLEALGQRFAGPSKEVDWGHLQGTLSVSGTTRAPRAEVSFAWEDARIAQERLTGSLRGTLVQDPREGPVVQFDASVSAGKGQLALKGAGGLEPMDLDFALEAAAVPLGPFSQAWGGDVGFSGTLGGKAELSYPKLEPRADVTLEDFAVSLPVSEFSGFDRGRLELHVRGSTGSVDFGAHAGDGVIGFQASGTKEAIQGQLVLEALPLTMPSLEVYVDTKTRVEVRELSKVKVVFEDSYVRVPSGGGAARHPIQPLPEVVFDDVEATETSSAVTPFEVRVETERPIRIRGEEVETDLELGVTATESRVEGVVATHRGSITLFGREYAMDRVRATFGGSRDPGLDVRLRHERPGFTLIVEVAGTGEHPEVRFSSDPATYDSTALLRIFLGTEPEELSSTDSTAPSDQATGMLASYIAGEVTKRLAAMLYLDSLSVDTEGATATGFRVGKWLTRRLFLSYRHRFTAAPNENTGEAMLRYGFLPGWQAEAVFGDRANGHLDLSWVKRF